MAWFDYRGKYLLQKTDLPDIRFHGIRHTIASLMLGLGVHLKLVQVRL